MDDKNMQIGIRQEEANDFPVVYDINLNAFKKKYEARLADRLRLSEAFIPELSLVAVVGNKVVGHILFTKIRIVGSGKTDSLALAPMAVSPEMQNKGIGSMLVRYGLDKAKSMGYKSVFVLGHTGFYSRFGFMPAGRWGIKSPFNVPLNVFMALELADKGLSGTGGTVEYAREFTEL